MKTTINNDSYISESSLNRASPSHIILILCDRINLAAKYTKFSPWLTLIKP